MKQPTLISATRDPGDGAGGQLREDGGVRGRRVGDPLPGHARPDPSDAGEAGGTAGGQQEEGGDVQGEDRGHRHKVEQGTGMQYS